MTKQVQRRRGTSTQHTSFTGAEGEISVNTTNKSIHVHDGVTAGGFQSARADLSNVTDASLNAALSGNTLASLTITSADINGGTIDGTTIGGTSAAAGTFTTVTGTSFVTSGDMTFGDNDKAVFGAGSDLQIYHDGSNSYIKENNATGHLVVNATNLYLRNSANSNDYLTAIDGGAVTLKYSGISTLATNATGIDVTGTVTADGLTLGTDSGDAFNAASLLRIQGTPDVYGSIKSATTGIAGWTMGDTDDDVTAGIFYNNASDYLYLLSNNAERMRITSAGNVGIGTSSPAYQLDVSSTATTLARFQHSDGNVAEIEIVGTLGATTIAERAGATAFDRDGTERMRITSTGNVGIGTSSPSSKLDIVGGATSAAIKLKNNVGQGLDLTGGSSGVDIKTPNALPITFGTSNIERMRIDSSGNVGIGTSSPTNPLDINADSIRVRTAQTPASASATGNQGEIAWDADYIYVCVATNTWKRVAIATW